MYKLQKSILVSSLDDAKLLMDAGWSTVPNNQYESNPSLKDISGEYLLSKTFFIDKLPLDNE